MSAKLSFSDVLAALPGLTPAQLETVEAATRTLRVAGKTRQGTRRMIRRGRSTFKVQRKQATSNFVGDPAYQQFKAAEKGLHSWLGSVAKSLKEAQEDPALRAAPVLTAFRTAQDEWFRKKAQLKAEPGTASAITSSRSAETAEEEKKSPTTAKLSSDEPK